MQQNPGLGKICFICRKKITSLDVEDKNQPMTMQSIPGFVHRKCKINGESSIVSGGFNPTDLTPELDKL